MHVSDVCRSCGTSLAVYLGYHSIWCGHSVVAGGSPSSVAIVKWFSTPSGWGNVLSIASVTPAGKGDDLDGRRGCNTGVEGRSLVCGKVVFHGE